MASLNPTGPFPSSRILFARKLIAAKAQMHRDWAGGC
jgi:hypothetical protein